MMAEIWELALESSMLRLIPELIKKQWRKVYNKQGMVWGQAIINSLKMGF